MIAIDLFAGAGGASTGLASLGLDPLGFEYDADAIATSRAAGHRTVRADLSSYDWTVLDGVEVDVLHGSPPCQPWSQGGRQRGADDPRDGMPWLLRAVEELRPRLVTVENVAGLTHKKNRPYLDDFVGSLVELGYDVEWRILNAADYGIPQTRRRLIVVARRDGVLPKWPDPTHAKDPADGLLPWVTMADALGWPDHYGVEQFRGSGMRERHGERPIRPATAPALSVTTSTPVRRWILHTDRPWPYERPATTVYGDPRVPAPGHHAEDESGSQMKDAVRITLEDLATLQGFPSGYPFTGGRTSMAKQIGNACPPALLAAVVGANL